MPAFINLSMAGAIVFRCPTKINMMKLKSCSTVGFFLKRGGFALALLLGGVLFSAAACTTTSQESAAMVPPTPIEDSAYAPILQKWSREAHVVEHFQKQVDINAVLFTDEMRRAYAERFARLRGNADAQLEDIGSGKLGFVVSVFSPVTDYLELDNRLLWTISARSGAQNVTTPTVRRLQSKTPFEAFFPFISRWSQDYLVIFDTSGQSGNPVLANPTSVTLLLRCALANVELNWK